ncbi:MAG: DUF819 family protein, partial [Myxococcota bacterium]
MVQSPVAVVAILAGISGFFFWLEVKTRWNVFQFFPPLLWIYAIPVLLNNVGVLPTENPAYDGFKAYVLPTFLVLMLLSVDLKTAIGAMGRGIVVMLAGSFGIVIGAVVSYALVSRLLPPDAWQMFGALSGAWIGGTGNMAAVAGGMGLDDLGLPILADNVIYVVWLPILLSSKKLAARFNRWAKVDPERIKRLESATDEGAAKKPVDMKHVMYLVAIAAAVIFVSNTIAEALPEFPPVLSTSTWKTLVLTTITLGLSFTPARKIPGSRPTGLALVYLFLASMGAKASIGGLGNAPVFLAAAFLWIAIHGAVLVAAARILRVDIHTAAIASAANIGGAASGPVVAAHHRESLVPASILMALIGYAGGNYLAVLTAQLCYWV